MNTTIYNRASHSKHNPYTLISNQLIKDSRLNAIAIGLMTLILSNNDTYIINVGTLKIQSGLTRTQFYNAWNLLQEYQYVIQHRDGKSSWQYIINEDVSPTYALDGM